MPIKVRVLLVLDQGFQRCLDLIYTDHRIHQHPGLDIFPFLNLFLQTLSSLMVSRFKGRHDAPEPFGSEKRIQKGDREPKCLQCNHINCMYSYSQHEIDGGKGDFAFASRNHNNVVQILKTSSSLTALSKSLK